MTLAHPAEPPRHNGEEADGSQELWSGLWPAAKAEDGLWEDQMGRKGPAPAVSSPCSDTLARWCQPQAPLKQLLHSSEYRGQGQPKSQGRSPPGSLLVQGFLESHPLPPSPLWTSHRDQAFPWCSGKWASSTSSPTTSVCLILGLCNEKRKYLKRKLPHWDYIFC